MAAVFRLAPRSQGAAVRFLPLLLVCGGRLFTTRKKAVLCVVNLVAWHREPGGNRGISEELSHHAAQRRTRSHLSHARHVLS